MVRGSGTSIWPTKVVDHLVDDARGGRRRGPRRCRSASRRRPTRAASGRRRPPRDHRRRVSMPKELRRARWLRYAVPLTAARPRAGPRGRVGVARCRPAPSRRPGSWSPGAGRGWPAARSSTASYSSIGGSKSSGLASVTTREASGASSAVMASPASTSWARWAAGRSAARKPCRPGSVTSAVAGCAAVGAIVAVSGHRLGGREAGLRRRARGRRCRRRTRSTPPSASRPREAVDAGRASRSGVSVRGAEGGTQDLVAPVRDVVGGVAEPVLDQRGQVDGDVRRRRGRCDRSSRAGGRRTSAWMRGSVRGGLAPRLDRLGGGSEGHGHVVGCVQGAAAARPSRPVGPEGRDARRGRDRRSAGTTAAR